MQFISDYQQLVNENRHIHIPDLVPSIHAWFIAPTEPMALQNWREMKAFFPKEWIVSISESTKTIETIGGGIIEIRSAYNPESLVGVALDFCSITEAARIKDLDGVVSNIEDRLNSPKRGIKGKGGRLILDSSPLGKNYFYEIWTWGQKNHSNYDSNWISYQLPSSANPYIAELYATKVKTKSGEEITYEESLRRRKGKKFLQDNLAQFIDSGGVVFPDFKQNCVRDIFVENRDKSLPEVKLIIKKFQEPKPFETYRIGYDPASGSSGDDPALAIRENSTNTIIKAIDLYGKIDDEQLNAVAYWAKYYNYAEVIVLKTGNLLVEGQLLKRGVNAKGIGEEGQNKRKYVQSLQAAVNNKDITVIDDGSAEIEKLIFEIEDYRESETTGKFSNQTKSSNDDFVSALYACYYDYSEIPEQKPPYMGNIGFVKVKKTNKMNLMYN